MFIHPHHDWNGDSMVIREGILMILKCLGLIAIGIIAAIIYVFAHLF